MTDDTDGTVRPDLGAPTDDRFGPETPGPDATPEQESVVRGLLGSLPADDPEIPEHVAARIDAVLAELARDGVGARSGTSSALGDQDDDAPAGPAPVTVLPSPAERRPSSSTRALRWIAGAAAAVVVVGVGAAAIRGAGTSNSDLATTAGAAAPERSGADPIRTSGTDYTSSDLAAKAQSLVQPGAVSPPGSATDAGSIDGGDATPATPVPSVTASGAPGLLSAATLDACLLQLTGRTGVVPVAVDQGTYEGQPADVVVLPSADSPSTLEVWVIGPGCTASDSRLYEYRVIASPPPSPSG